MWGGLAHLRAKAALSGSGVEALGITSMGGETLPLGDVLEKVKFFLHVVRTDLTEVLWPSAFVVPKGES